MLSSCKWLKGFSFTCKNFTQELAKYGRYKNLSQWFERHTCSSSSSLTTASILPSWITSLVMMEYVKIGLTIFVLCSFAHLSLCDEATTTTTDAPSSKPGRIGRKYYDAEVYTGSDVEAVPLSEHGFQPRSLVAKKYIPYRQAGSGIMKKTGNNPHWNAWRGDADDNNSEDADDSDHNDGGPKWQPPPPQAWGNDAWVADPMYVMMLKNAMTELKGDSKPSGLLSKLTSEPALLLIAASIPISLLLAAVLPAVMSYVASGSNSVPTITTTATGTRARNSHADILPYMTPVLEAIGTFGVRSIGNPDCMQRIFCQVAQEKVVVKSPKYFRKAATVAKFLANSNWLGDFGVKDLVESLSNGNCENIPCSHSFPGKETVKSRYSQKAQTNTIQ